MNESAKADILLRLIYAALHGDTWSVDRLRRINDANGSDEVWAELIRDLVERNDKIRQAFGELAAEMERIGAEFIEGIRKAFMQ